MNLEKFRYSYEVSEMIFGFLEGEDDSPMSRCEIIAMDEEEVDKGEDLSSGDEKKAFWESQQELLQATLYRTTSFETKIRQATKDALRQLNSVGINCYCKKMVANNSCSICKKKMVSSILQAAGFNCVICKSKWKTSSEIPAGEHTYLEVVELTKKGVAKVIIELNFRSEFQVARACEDYNQLVEKLPEVFVGKIERLRNLIKILCSSSNKCMKDRKMHIAPWRKQKYMQAKWQGNPLPQAAVPPPSVVVEPPVQRPKPSGSMLTFDLADNMTSGLNFKTIKVI